MINRIGLIFGRLIIKSVAPESHPKYIKYMCQCSCGTIKSISIKALTSGGTKSCGCLAKEILERGTKYAGQKFGRLTVVKGYNKINLVGTKKYVLQVICECKNIENTYAVDLLSGAKKQCRQCWEKENKQKSELGVAHPLYRTWRGMISRCYDKKLKMYIYYGGKGIIIDSTWMGGIDGFFQFCKDMGDKPTQTHSVDRIDNNANYSPSNCRWATITKQANNRSNSLPIGFRTCDVKEKRDNKLIKIKGKKQTLNKWVKELGVTVSSVQNLINKGLTVDVALIVAKFKRVEWQKSQGYGVKVDRDKQYIAEAKHILNTLDKN